jgi:hypothetical protein
VEKAGNIIKCPNCGASLPSMAAICPQCGHELRNVEASKVIKEFTEKLAKSKGPNTIKNFPIPNTREGISEFIIFCSSRYEGKLDNSTDAAWINKCQEAYKRAVLLLGDDKAHLERLTSLLREKEIPLTPKEMAAYKAKVNKHKAKENRKGWLPIVLFFVILFGGGLVIPLVVFEANEAKKEREADQKIDILIPEIMEAISSEDTVTAKFKMAELDAIINRNDYDGSREKTHEARKKYPLLLEDLYKLDPSLRPKK